MWNLSTKKRNTRKNSGNARKRERERLKSISNPSWRTAHNNKQRPLASHVKISRTKIKKISLRAKNHETLSFASHSEILNSLYISSFLFVFTFTLSLLLLHLSFSLRLFDLSSPFPQQETRDPPSSSSTVTWVVTHLRLSQWCLITLLLIKSTSILASFLHILQPQLTIDIYSLSRRLLISSPSNLLYFFCCCRKSNNP